MHNSLGGGALHVQSTLDLPVNGPMVLISLSISIWYAARRWALPCPLYRVQPGHGRDQPEERPNIS